MRKKKCEINNERVGGVKVILNFLPAGKLRTPTPTTALTMLNISLLIVAVPPPCPPRTSLTTSSLIRVCLSSKDGFFNASPRRRRELDIVNDDKEVVEITLRALTATFGTVAQRTRRRMHSVNFVIVDSLMFEEKGRVTISPPN